MLLCLVAEYPVKRRRQRDVADIDFFRVCDRRNFVDTRFGCGLGAWEFDQFAQRLRWRLPIDFRRLQHHVVLLVGVAELPIELNGGCFVEFENLDRRYRIGCFHRRGHRNIGLARNWRFERGMRRFEGGVRRRSLRPVQLLFNLHHRCAQSVRVRIDRAAASQRLDPAPKTRLGDADHAHHCRRDGLVSFDHAVVNLLDLVREIAQLGQPDHAAAALERVESTP